MRSLSYWDTEAPCWMLMHCNICTCYCTHFNIVTREGMYAIVCRYKITLFKLLCHNLWHQTDLKFECTSIRVVIWILQSGQLYFSSVPVVFILRLQLFFSSVPVIFLLRLQLYFSTVPIIFLLRPPALLRWCPAGPRRLQILTVKLTGEHFLIFAFYFTMLPYSTVLEAPFAPCNLYSSSHLFCPFLVNYQFVTASFDTNWCCQSILPKHAVTNLVWCMRVRGWV